jgi:hypothetical protein
MRKNLPLDPSVAIPILTLGFIYENMNRFKQNLKNIYFGWGGRGALSDDTIHSISLFRYQRGHGGCVRNDLRSTVQCQ